MSTFDEISPAELLQDVLERELPDNAAPGGVGTGPLTNDAQQLGAVELKTAGGTRRELYAPLIWLRTEIRCVARTLEQAEKIGSAVQFTLSQHGRVVAVMASTDKSYLIHLINITVTPAMQYDSPETWAMLLFAETLIGLDPVS